MSTATRPFRDLRRSGVSIHPTAIVDRTCELGEDVEIGPYAIVEAGTSIGDRTRILASAFIGARTAIGADCAVHQFAVLGGPAQIRGVAGPGGGVRIGSNNIVREHVTIHAARHPGHQTVIGSDCFLLASCHVAHDCAVGDHVTIANGSLLAGHVTLEDGAFVSGNVVIHQFVKVGAHSMIGGLSRVSKDVPPFVVIVGDSEVRGVNTVGMRRAGMSAAARQNVRRAYQLVYRSRLNVSQALARRDELPATPEVDAWIAFIRNSTRGICSTRR